MFVVHSNLRIFRRRLFTIASALSLLLCLATIALWVRSYWLHEEVVRRSPDRQVTMLLLLNSTWGELGIGIDFFETVSPWPKWNYSRFASSSDSRIRTVRNKVGVQVVAILGFGYLQANKPNGSTHWIFFPHWFLALLLAIAPALHLRNILRTRRRNRIGLCQRCGYDLRAPPGR